MSKKWSLEKWQRDIIFYIVSILGIYLVFKYIMPLVVPFLIGFVLIYWLFPVFYRMEKKWKIKKEWSVIFFMVIFFLFLCIFMWGIFRLGVYGASMLQESSGEIEVIFREFVATSCDFIEEKTGFGKENIEQSILLSISQFSQSVQTDFIEVLMNHGVNYSKKILPILAFLGVFLIATLLICKEFEPVMEKVKKIGALDPFMDFMEGFLHTILTYGKAQVCIILTIAVICSITLSVIGVQGGGLIGILAGFLDALPFIGTGIVLLPTAIWQFINGNLWKALGCLLLYIVCVMIREWLEPRLIGKKLGVSPLLILFSVYAGVQLFGMGGIIKGPLCVVILREVWKYYGASC